jgi:hypothetical protein
MMDREIRLTATQTATARDAIARRRRELERRLERTSYDGKPGMKDAVVNDVRELRELERILEVARDAMKHQLRATVARGAKQQSTRGGEERRAEARAELELLAEQGELHRGV